MLLVVRRVLSVFRAYWREWGGRMLGAVGALNVTRCFECFEEGRWEMETSGEVATDRNKTGQGQKRVEGIGRENWGAEVQKR